MKVSSMTRVEAPVGREPWTAGGEEGKRRLSEWVDATLGGRRVTFSEGQAWAQNRLRAGPEGTGAAGEVGAL